ncbi:MAG: hypothetical protein NTY37_06995 [Methanothrix sp.]|nr:hypothetical protein [Methanothrix sp.]
MKIHPEPAGARPPARQPGGPWRQALVQVLLAARPGDVRTQAGRNSQRHLSASEQARADKKSSFLLGQQKSASRNIFRPCDQSAA